MSAMCLCILIRVFCMLEQLKSQWARSQWTVFLHRGHMEQPGVLNLCLWGRSSLLVIRFSMNLAICKCVSDFWLRLNRWAEIRVTSLFFVSLFMGTHLWLCCDLVIYVQMADSAVDKTC